MKTFLLFLIILSSGFLYKSCVDTHLVYSSDNITEEVRDISEFNEIDVSNGFRVILKKGEVQKLEIKANENLHKHIISKINKGELEIEVEDKIRFDRNAEILIKITYINLTDIDASGGCKFTIEDKFEGEALDIDMSGGATLDGVIITDKLKAELSGGGKINISGSANLFDLQLSGGGSAKGFDFIINDFVGELSGGSSAELTVNNSISLEASGGSKLSYKGDAEIKKQNLSGGSKIIKK